MSIFDGQCDYGSKANNQCPEPATHYARGYTSAYCEDHKISFGQRMNSSWAEVAEQHNASQREVQSTIETAERDGLFLWHDSKVYSPREIRQVIKNGWTVDSLSTVDPEEMASSYEMEADREEACAKEKREQARHIRREVARQQRKSSQTVEPV